MYAVELENTGRSWDSPIVCFFSILSIQELHVLENFRGRKNRPVLSVSVILMFDCIDGIFHWQSSVNYVTNDCLALLSIRNVLLR